MTREHTGVRVPASALAWGLTIVSVATALAGIALHLWPGEQAAGEYGSWWFTNAVAGIAIALPGGLVAARRPRNPLGWLLIAWALSHGLTAAGREYALHAVAHGGLPFGTVGAWLSNWLYIDFPFVIPLLFLFPDGRVASRRWLWIMVPGLSFAGVITVWAATYPGPMLPAGHPVDPLAWPWLASTIDRLGSWPVYILLGVALAAIAQMLVKAQAAPGPVRRGIVLVAIAAAVMIAEVAHEDLYPSFRYEEYAGASVVALVAVAMTVAILRYRIAEVDVVVSRTVVYGSVTLVLASAYVAVAALAGAVTDSRALGAIPAAIVVALLFAPLRAWLQRLSDRLLFGDRDDPYAVISSLGAQLHASDAGEVLPALAATVAQTLRLPYVAIESEQEDGRELVAEHGALRGEPLALPLSYGGAAIGRLVLGPRTPGERFSAAETRLFADIARQVAVAAHAVRLTAELQRSRGDLVTAREEERRRLHRDLHDGLGPSLAGISLQIGSARLLLTRDAAAADRLLGQLVEETTTAIADVRRLIYALRPPALDELGLVPALRMQADRFPGLDVEVRASDRIESLPAAVEVAAYRIATEALTNVSRHAAASRCTITLGVDGHLELEVRDDGAGMAQGWRPGVGVASIRERAAELGGTCEVASAAGGGTCVVARLPLPAT